jgi:hypothetical protein
MVLKILVFSALGIGFASGYGVREWISRRRWIAAREAYYERHPEKRHSVLKSIIACSRVEE